MSFFVTAPNYSGFTKPQPNEKSLAAVQKSAGPLAKSTQQGKSRRDMTTAQSKAAPQFAS